MKYMPVLRFRQEERGALLQLSSLLTSKTLPLIEIVMEKPNTRSKSDFSSIYCTALKDFNIPLLVDFPMHLPLTRATSPKVSNFLRPIQTDLKLRIAKYEMLKELPDAIFTVSYNPKVPLVKGSIAAQAKALRSISPTLAFRLFIPNLSQALAEVKKTAHHGDYLICDIDDAPHGNPALFPIYDEICKVALSLRCSSVIIRSAIEQSVTHVGLVDDQAVLQADNSLLTHFNNYGFSGFGDYAGIKKDNLQAGGSISPGFVFYSWHDNCYYGYSGRVRTLQEFEDHIVPTVVVSRAWKKYSKQHHANCPGCATIEKIRSHKENGKHQGKWKRITMMHYIYTMEEFL